MRNRELGGNKERERGRVTEKERKGERGGRERGRGSWCAGNFVS
jgi:hypothetical protein